MTIGNLARNTTVQGDVRLCLWKNGGIICEDWVTATQDLYHEACVQQFWKRKNIAYIFAVNNVLTIDVEED